MLKDRSVNELLVAICLALTVALISVLTVPPNRNTQGPQVAAHQQTEKGVKTQNDSNEALTGENNRGDPQGQYGHEEISEYWTILGRKLKITDSFLVLFTFTLWVATRDLVRDARKTSKRQLRAYLLPESTDGSKIDPPKAHFANVPGCVLYFRNSGQTPAYKIVTWVDMVISEYGNESGLTVPILQEIAPANLGGNSQMPRAVRLNRMLSEEEVVAIRSCQKAIYLYGRVEYRDAFRKKRFSNFRLFYTGDYPAPDGAFLTFCREGNETEEND